jgi:hypothetical protein
VGAAASSIAAHEDRYFKPLALSLEEGVLF